ncbi:unnamed protein product [Heterobilharzia americana]|nr:unnamed protein product [Heterobilharzia americana]
MLQTKRATGDLRYKLSLWSSSNALIYAFRCNSSPTFRLDKAYQQALFTSKQRTIFNSTRMKEEKIKKIKSIIDFFTTPIDEAELIDGESKPDELYTLCDDPMQVPIKLIDEQLRFVDLATLQELFVENSGFLVVGAIGLQDRVILLDVQPLLSFALTNYHTHMATSAEMTSTSAGNHTGLSSPIGPGNWNLDVWAEMASMQIVAF